MSFTCWRLLPPVRRLQMRFKYSPCMMGKTRLSLPIIQFKASKINRWWSTDVLVFLAQIKHLHSAEASVPKNKTKKRVFVFPVQNDTFALRDHVEEKLWMKAWVDIKRTLRRRVSRTQEEGSSSCRSSSSPSRGPSPVLAFLKTDNKDGSQLLWSLDSSREGII